MATGPTVPAVNDWTTVTPAASDWQTIPPAHQEALGYLAAIQKSFDNSVAHKPTDSAFTSGVKTMAGDVGGAIAHPLDAAASMGRTLFPLSVAPGGQVGMAPSQGAQQLDATQQDFAQNGTAKGLADLAGHVVAMGAMAGAGGGMAEAAGAVPAAGTAIREAALGDPDAAALKGLRVSPTSPRAAQTLQAVQGARPFLQGVQGLEDLQARVPVAKQEIWQPYQDALAKVGDRQVKGPDGNMTTVADLEARRLELSAQLRTLRNGGPEAFSLAQQKGLTQANLLREQSAVQSVLDPQLRSAGIDPVAIRKAFGQVAQVGSKVAGKTTIGQASQPSGLGHLQSVNLQKPLSYLSEIGSAGKDIAAGRPWLSANPTDLNIREAFRNGGAKPNFAVPAQPEPEIAGLLQRPPIEMPGPADSSNPLSRPPMAAATTRAQRLGLLLPEKTGGPVELPYTPEMSGGEQMAALMQYLRKRQQLGLPAKASAIPLSSGR